MSQIFNPKSFGRKQFNFKAFAQEPDETKAVDGVVSTTETVEHEPVKITRKKQTPKQESVEENLVSEVDDITSLEIEN